MQLTPVYGTHALITLDGPPGAIAAPAIRQRRRLAEIVAAFTDEQWAHPSRCAGWSNRDVIAHLDSTNAFWNFSMAAGLAGEPSQFLATFDPVVTPAQLVAGTAAMSTADVRDAFLASTQSLVERWSALTDAEWTLLAEAPPGHLTMGAVTHHALWDSWIHERDILLPLGITPAEEPDEIAASLRYVAALSPAFTRAHGATDPGVLAVDVSSPDVAALIVATDRVAVTEGLEHSGSTRVAPDLTLTGDAVELLEALSFRVPLTQPIDPSAAWLVDGLAEVFDLTDR